MLNDSSDKAITPAIELKKGTATFADNVITLAGGATLAQGVTILASPITSRLFGPEAFGLAALFRSGTMILGTIACLRYEMAIVLPKNDEHAAQLFALCYITLMAMTALTVILTYLFGTRALVYLDAVELKPILWLFPIYVFVIGLQLPLSFWYTRQKQFKIKATNHILKSLPISIGEIGGGFAGFRTGMNLVVIRFFCLIISPAFLVWRLLSGDARFIMRNINRSEILKFAKRYIKFPMLESWSILLVQLSVHAPIILLTSFFSPAIGGLYTKALYLLQVPSNIIGQSVGQVFLQESAVSKAQGKNLAELVETVFNRMITLGTLPFAMLAIIGPDLFGLFLGARWTEAGVYAQILTPQLFLAFSVGSIFNLFGTLGRQELNLIFYASSLILRLSSLIYGGLFLRDARLTLIIFTAANVMVTLWGISMLMRATKLSATRPLAHLMRCVAYVVPSIASIALMKWWFCLEAAYLVALTSIFSIPYIALVLRHDRELRNLFLKYLRRVQAFL